jgi:hypothetical protein
MRPNDGFREVKIGMGAMAFGRDTHLEMSLLVTAANAIRGEAVPAIVPACYREEVRFRS